MTMREIARELVAGCREGREMENLGKLYAEDCVSVEAMDQGQGRVTEGLAGIRGKHEWWNSTFEVKDGKVEGPFPHGDDRFAVIFSIDATHKESGQRSKVHEVAVYHVAGGKIVREEFFY